MYRHWSNLYQVMILLILKKPPGQGNNSRFLSRVCLQTTDILLSWRCLSIDRVRSICNIPANGLLHKRISSSMQGLPIVGKAVYSFFSSFFLLKLNNTEQARTKIIRIEPIYKIFFFKLNPPFSSKYYMYICFCCSFKWI